MAYFHPYSHLFEKTIVGNVDMTTGNVDKNRAEHKRRQLELRLDTIVSDIEFIKGALKDGIDVEQEMLDEIKARFDTFFMEYGDALPMLKVLQYDN